jgi:pteridine reductase
MYSSCLRKECDNMELHGRVAIVTGGAVRLGKAMALALVDEGLRVAVHYNSSAGPAEKTVAEIQALGGVAVAIQGDLSQSGEALTVVERAAARLGQVDILVNSAGIFEPAGLAQTTEALWDRQFAVNLKAPFFLSQAFAAHVGRERWGHIVNIADWRGLRPDTAYLAYSLTKAGVMTMTQGLALALAPNIQVNAIAPGAILPPPGKDQAYLDQLAQAIPAGKVGSPAEIAGTLIYLLKSDFVTGQTIFVTGGEHLI